MSGAEELAHAEHQAEIKPLRSVQIAAAEQKYWRAAAWLLERRNPEDFAARGARLFTAQQVSDMCSQIIELLRGDMPEENCRRALGKLDEWLSEFTTGDAPVLVARKEEGDEGEATKDEGGGMKDEGMNGSVVELRSEAGTSEPGGETQFPIPSQC
jgi:hypothetical protein